MSEFLVKELLGTIPQVGRLEWIGLRPAHRVPVQAVSEVEAVTGYGLRGDRYAESPGSKRQVTLIQSEHLPLIASLTGRDHVPPEWLRRNLVVSGINLLSLKDKQFYIGDVLLEGTGLCHPCTRMEEVLGPGGYNVMRGHGGITARILVSGTIQRGLTVTYSPGKPVSG